MYIILYMVVHPGRYCHGKLAKTSMGDSGSNRLREGRRVAETEIRNMSEFWKKYVSLGWKYI